MKNRLIALLLAATAGCVTETQGPEPVVVDAKQAISQRVALARQYIGAGDWDNAKRNLELAASIDEDNPEVLEAFALVFQSTGEFELAAANFTRALERGAGSRARNNYAAFLFSQGQYQQSADEFREVTADTLYSGRPRAFVNLGLALLQLGSTNEARQAFTRSLFMDSRNPTALLELTQISLTEGDVEAASGYYTSYRQSVRGQSARALILGVEIARLSGDADLEASNLLSLRNLHAEAPIYKVWSAAQLEQR
jgi:type IV pilus assembly protein PilF